MNTLDYDFARLDLGDDSETGRARRTGWVQAVQFAFHEGRVSEEFEKLWLAHVAADGVECHGAWLPEGAYGASPVPVATTSWFDKTLNCGRESLPLRMVTDVTTSPAHRRQGLVRRLMEDCLDDAVSAGLPLAALTVSEATIYGRWGYGAATFVTDVEIDTGPRFGLRDFTDPGRVELIDPRGSWDLITERIELFRQRTRGAVGLPQFYEPFLTGRWNFREAGEDKHLRAAVHLTPDETVDGLVLYRQDGRDDQGARKLKVSLMVSESPEGYLGLWQFLGGIDLVRWLTFDCFAPEDPVRWALRDINALKVKGHQEFLWVRVLDVARAFPARPWHADGEVVLDVADAQGHVAGRWLVRTHDGVAQAEATDREPDLALDAETLGSLYLSGVDIETLYGAGRITGSADAARRFGAMADLPDEPFNFVGF
ncbi:MAG: GNAT family N-acetyltransferase [Nocardioides sp.]